MPIMGISKFERFFRSAASLDVDKNDLKRYNDFLDSKVHDLFLIGSANAKASRRDIIEPSDLPLTKGLQEAFTSFARWTKKPGWLLSWNSSLRRGPRWMPRSARSPRANSPRSQVG